MFQIWPSTTLHFELDARRRRRGPHVAPSIWINLGPLLVLLQFKAGSISLGVIGRLCSHLNCRDTWIRCAGRPERSRPPVHTTAAAPRPTPNIHLAHFFTSSRSVWNKNGADVHRAFALVKFYAEMPFGCGGEAVSPGRVLFVRSSSTSSSRRQCDGGGRSGLFSLCNSSYSLWCPLWPLASGLWPKEADIRDLLVLLAQAHPNSV